MSKRNYKSREFLLAQHEADQARIAGLTVEITTLKRRISEMTDQLTVANHAPQTRPSPRQLMDKAKELASQGVPCYVRGGYIYHSQTKAILV